MSPPRTRSNVVSVFNNNPPLDAVQTLSGILATDPHVRGDFSETSLLNTHTVSIHVDVIPGAEQEVKQLAADVRAMVRQRGGDPGARIIRVDIVDQLTNTAY